MRDNAPTYLNLQQAVAAYPGVFTERLLRRLVAERRIAFSKCGNRLVFREDDLIAHLEAGRCEPVSNSRGRSNLRTVPTSANASTSIRGRAHGGARRAAP